MKMLARIFLIVFLLASLSTNIYLMRLVENKTFAVDLLIEMVKEQQREIAVRKAVCDINL